MLDTGMLNEGRGGMSGMHDIGMFNEGRGQHVW